MRIRFVTSIAGAGWVQNVGTVSDIDEDQAFRLVAAGVAELVVDLEPVETATAPQPKLETAATKTKPLPKPIPATVAAAK